MGGAGADGYERSEGAAVIKMIYIILTLVSGILLSGVWFGLNFLIQICVEKSKVKFLERYSVIAASVICAEPIVASAMIAELIQVPAGKSIPSIVVGDVVTTKGFTASVGLPI